MEDSDFSYLFDLSARIGAVQGHIRDRDERIVSLLRYKRATVADITRATGLTKSRIYQIVEAAK